MKAATGELSLTVITIIAIAAIAALFAILWPKLRDKINNGWGNTETNVNDYTTLAEDNVSYM